MHMRAPAVGRPLLFFKCHLNSRSVSIYTNTSDKSNRKRGRVLRKRGNSPQIRNRNTIGSWHGSFASGSCHGGFASGSWHGGFTSGSWHGGFASGSWHEGSCAGIPGSTRTRTKYSLFSMPLSLIPRTPWFLDSISSVAYSVPKYSLAFSRVIHANSRKSPSGKGVYRRLPSRATCAMMADGI